MEAGKTKSRIQEWKDRKKQIEEKKAKRRNYYKEKQERLTAEAKIRMQLLRSKRKEQKPTGVKTRTKVMKQGKRKENYAKRKHEPEK